MYKLLVLALVFVVVSRCLTSPVERCPAKDSSTAVFLADDTYCNIFYECSNGDAYEVMCPPSTNYDPTKTSCSSEYADCGDKGQKDALDTTTQSTAAPNTPAAPNTTAAPITTAAPNTTAATD